MAVARYPGQAVVVPRLLVLWSRPYHLAAGEAERWVRAEVRQLPAADGVMAVALRRLESASPRLGHQWDWLLELEVAAPVADRVESGPCADWLADLRLLGMRPTVLLVSDDRPPEGGGG